jgi:hypothetical protein
MRGIRDCNPKLRTIEKDPEAALYPFGDDITEVSHLSSEFI